VAGMYNESRLGLSVNICNYACNVIRCLHFTAGCTTGWVKCANEPSQAALERSIQDAYDVIRLTRSKAAVWTVDDVARWIEFFFKEFLFIYLFLPSVACDPEG